MCDEGCNSEECNWDGLDCDNSPPKIAEGTLSVTILIEPDVFWKITQKFIRAISTPLRTSMRIKLDLYGNQMIYPLQKGQVGVKVYLELDNRKCADSLDKECFFSASKAAEFLAATHSKHELNTGFPIQKIEGFERQTDMQPPGEDDISEESSNMVYIVIACFAIVMCMVILGVLVTSRKKARAITWFPEGFFRTNSGQRRRQSKRRGPDGQEMRNLHKQPSSNHVNLDANDNATMPQGANGMRMDMSHWRMDDSEACPAKRIKVHINYSYFYIHHKFVVHILNFLILI